MIWKNLTTVLENHFPALDILEQVPLSKYTTMNVGGKAPLMVFPSSVDEAVEMMYDLDEVPVFVIGKGSNLIINDDGVDALFINTSQMNLLCLDEHDPTKIIAEAGATLKDLSDFALMQGLTGLEFACGIPGTVGGAVYMNAGAYGSEIKDVLEYTEAFMEFSVEKISNEDHQFGYRHSIFADDPSIILRSVFALTLGDKEEIRAKMDDLTVQRESKQPLEFPSAGSIFKRPEGYFAGKLIMDCGLQGYNINGAEVSTKHAGFIVNTGNATTKDILELIAYIQKVVKDKMGVQLEPEVKLLEKDGTFRTL